MKKLAIGALLIAFATPSFAAEKAGAGSADDPMKGWSPPKIKNEKADRAEITALMNKFEAAGKKGDLESAMSLIEFPVLMTTDNSKGEAMSTTWDAEQYRKEMEPFFKPMPDMKVKHKPTVFLITDSLATVTDVATITMGNKTITARNAMLLVRTGGQWKVKAMTEGGWGDMMGESGGSHGTTKTSSSSTGSTGTSTSSTPSTGSSDTSTSSTPSTGSTATGTSSSTGTGSMSGTDNSSTGTGSMSGTGSSSTSSTGSTTGTTSTPGSTSSTDSTSTTGSASPSGSSTTGSTSSTGTGSTPSTGTGSSGSSNASEPAPAAPPASR